MYKYYEIKVDTGLCNTGRTIRTEKGIDAIKEHVTHDKMLVHIKDFTPRLVDCKEVTKEKYDEFISLFVKEEQEKVIAGTTV